MNKKKKNEKMVTFRMSEDDYDSLHYASLKKDMTVSELIRTILYSYLFKK